MCQDVCKLSLSGAFLVPYVFMLVVLGIPLLYMELIVGQYLRKGPVHVLEKVCPLLKGKYEDWDGIMDFIAWLLSASVISV